MNISQYDLSDDEKALLIEATDFGVPLYELLHEMKLSNSTSSSSEVFERAKGIVLSIVQKDLLSLCKLTSENIENHTYEVNETTQMTFDEVKSHIECPTNWVQDNDVLDSSISYELAPTKLGEMVLDEIFNVGREN